jgi:hypothetical protein
MVTRGTRNNNPGNIDKGQNFQGEVQGTDSRFATFSTPVYGIRAIAKILVSYSTTHGINTITGAITRWAPGTENNTAAYIADVVERTGIPGDEVIDFQNEEILDKIVTAIIWHENGECPYTEQQISDGVDAAL